MPDASVNYSAPFTLADVKPYVMQKLQSYCSVPSLSKQEAAFLRLLQDDFPPKSYQSWYTFMQDGQPLCAFLEDSSLFHQDSFVTSTVRSPKSFVLVAHVDRVPDFKSMQAYSALPATDDTLLKGQLDNCISLAILRFLHEKIAGQFSILFTTNEEESHSWEQISLFLQATSPMRRYVPIGIDIEPFKELPKTYGWFSLRYRDDAGEMNYQAVTTLMMVANYLQLPFTTCEGSANTEIGYLSHFTKGEKTGAHIGLPIINYHTDFETLQWGAVVNVVNLLYTFILNYT